LPTDDGAFTYNEAFTMSTIKDPSLTKGLGQSECDADTDSSPPDNAALFLGCSMEKFKPIRQRYHRKYFEARSAD